MMPLPLVARIMQFEVAVIIVHHGALDDSGHYRCFWKKKDQIWIADDGIAAEVCNLQIWRSCPATRIWNGLFALSAAQLPRSL